MKNIYKIVFLLAIVLFSCITINFFLYEGYTIEERDSDKQKIMEVKTIIESLFTSGVLPRKIPLSDENKTKLEEVVGAFVRIIQDDAIKFINQNTSEKEQQLKGMVSSILTQYTTPV
jgi:hypothetical protein